MPADALPVPRNAIPGTTRHRRVYRDALGRPLGGQVVITGRARLEAGELSVMGAAPVAVQLVDGVLEVDLPADTYSFVAELYTAEGVRVIDRGEFQLDPPADRSDRRGDRLPPV